MRLLAVFVATVFALGGFAPQAADTMLARGDGGIIVRVTARDFSFRLSRTSLPLGTARFAVTNLGAIPHDFAIAGKKTRLLKHGERATLVVRFRKAGRYAYRCSVSGHASLGMKGVVVVGKPKRGGAGTPSSPTGSPQAEVTLTPIGKFERPVFAVSPPGDTRRLFVVEQSGLIRELVDGVLLERPFLDITRFVHAENETGLLSLAFAPDYSTSRRFYVYFNDNVGSHNVNVVEFQRSQVDPEVADPASYRQVLTIVKPWENHNAGMMQFGPDGYLYIAVGDGDSGARHPPGAFAQTLDDLLGSILRIDPAVQRDGAPYGVPHDNPFVGVAGARPEIWAYGLRNPWRFWIDPRSGDLYLGDVGEGRQEEIDVIPAGHGGENFGWPCFEGTAVFDATSSCPNSVAPVLAYDHVLGCSVIGGVIGEDPRLPKLLGRFLYGDYCSGEIRSMLYVNGHVLEDKSVGVKLPQTMSFGEDGLGRIYVTSLADRMLYRLDPVP